MPLDKILGQLTEAESRGKVCKGKVRGNKRTKGRWYRRSQKAELQESENEMKNETIERGQIKIRTEESPLGLATWKTLRAVSEEAGAELGVRLQWAEQTGGWRVSSFMLPMKRKEHSRNQ